MRPGHTVGSSIIAIIHSIGIVISKYNICTDCKDERLNSILQRIDLFVIHTACLSESPYVF